MRFPGPGNQGLNLPRSHISEMMATLLEYGSLAALHMENVDTTLDYHLKDTELLERHLPAGDQ